MTTKYNIVLAQINPTVGDLKNNTKKILNIIKNELSVSLGLVGLTDIKDVTETIISKNLLDNLEY